MNNTSSNKDLNGMAGYLDWFAISLLLAHFFVIGYPAFQPGGIVGNITDALYRACSNLPFLVDAILAKSLILALTVFPAFFLTKPGQRKIGWQSPLATLLTGILIFFGTCLLTPVEPFGASAVTYAGITFLGYVLILFGSGRLAQAMKYVFHADRFQQDTTGFKQEERLIVTPHSLNFPARYAYNGKWRKSHINIINPRRGVLIMGLPGSGKSWFIIEPAIEQLVQKGMAMLVYDFKYPTLSRFTYNSFLRHKENYPASTRFYCINFTDLSRSHRCNLIDPKTLEFKNDAMAISRTIFLSMNKAAVAKQGDFFVESAISYLAALVWYLKVYKKGVYCTLPHVIELSKMPYDQLFTILNAESTTRGFIAPFRDAFMNGTTEMLDGQTTSARIPLGKLDSPDIYYVLSGQDLSLEINDPKGPAILCLGSDPKRHEALTSILSLYIDRINRQINHPGGHPTALVIDEFATVRATSMLDTMATGRSNDITPILVIQDLSQLRQRYSHDEADQIMNTAGNLICGQTLGESAQRISERFHSTFGLKTTISVNSSDISTSKTEQVVDAISPSILANLSSGEFVGLVADDPDKKLELKAFHATLTKTQDDDQEVSDLPIVNQVDEATIIGNYELIGLQIAELVKEETKRILGDPQLRQYVVKR